jgi:hypothetical protein
MMACESRTNSNQPGEMMMKITPAADTMNDATFDIMNALTERKHSICMTCTGQVRMQIGKGSRASVQCDLLRNQSFLQNNR